MQNKTSVLEIDFFTSREFQGDLRLRQIIIYHNGFVAGQQRKEITANLFSQINL